MRGLGAEPLAPEFDAARLAGLFAGSRAPLKSALLDQKRIAGLGNIYVCEALFRAGLKPSRPASTVPEQVLQTCPPTDAEMRLIREVLDPEHPPRGRGGRPVSENLADPLRMRLTELTGFRWPVVQTGMGWWPGRGWRPRSPGRAGSASWP